MHRDLDTVSEILRTMYPVEKLETIQPGSLTVAYSAEKPTDWLDAGKLTGLHGQVRTLVANILNLDVTPVHLQWPKMIPAVASREIDVPGLGTAWTSERAARFRYTQPFQYFFLGIAQPVTSHVQGIEEFRQLRVSTISPGFNYPELQAVVSDGKLFARPTVDEVIDDVTSGRADVGLDDLPRLEHSLLRHPSRSEFHVLPFLFSPEYPLTTAKFPIYFIFHPDAPHLRAAADLALDLLKTSGKLQEVYESYGFHNLLSIQASSG